MFRGTVLKRGRFLFVRSVRQNKNRTITIGWWNTSCNPYGGCSIIPFSKIAPSVTSLLRRCDFLTLGEFDQFDSLSNAIDLINHKDGTEFVVKSLKDSIGSVQYKNCLVYRKNIFGGCKVVAKSYFQPKFRGLVKNYRIGQRIRVSFAKNQFDFDLYLIHWRPTHDQHKIHRREAAETLLSLVEKSLYDRRIVCIGDFNIEPYEDIMNTLLATRSSSLAHESNLFFNPTWSLLGDGMGTLSVSLRAKELLTPELVTDQALVNAMILDGFDVQCRVVRKIDGRQEGHHHPIILKLKEK